jgi:hypothetical protein
VPGWVLGPSGGLRRRADLRVRIDVDHPTLDQLRASRLLWSWRQSGSARRWSLMLRRPVQLVARAFGAELFRECSGVLAGTALRREPPDLGFGAARSFGSRCIGGRRLTWPRNCTPRSARRGGSYRTTARGTHRGAVVGCQGCSLRLCGRVGQLEPFARALSLRSLPFGSANVFRSPTDRGGHLRLIGRRVGRTDLPGPPIRSGTGAILLGPCLFDLLVRGGARWRHRG